MAIIGMAERVGVEKQLADLKQIADEKWLPYVREFDAMGGAQAQIKMAEQWKDYWAALRDTKLLVTNVPKELGGLGLVTMQQVGLILYSAVIYGQSVAFGCNLGQNTGIIDTVLKFASSDDVRRKYVNRMINGGICCIANIEPKAGDDIAAMQVQALLDGDYYVVNGDKWWVGYPDPGPFGQNFAMVLCKTDPTAGIAGLSYIIVDSDSPGVVLGREGDQMPSRPYVRYELKFRDCKVPKENLLGKPGDGRDIIKNWMHWADGSVGWEALALGRAALDYTIEYTKTRETFGHFLYENQGVHYALADMIMAEQAGEAFMEKASIYYDEEDPNHNWMVPAARQYCTDMTEKLIPEALHLFQARGQERNEGHPMERYYRDIQLLQNTGRGRNLERHFIAQSYLGKKLRVSLDF